MSEYNHERELGEVYAAQLERAAESLQAVHPIGKVKHIGRLEVARAVEDLVADLAALRERCERAEGLLSRVTEYIHSGDMFFPADPLWREIEQAADAAKKNSGSSPDNKSSSCESSEHGDILA